MEKNDFDLRLQIKIMSIHIDYSVLVTYAIYNITNSTDKNLCSMDCPSET
jgi:hypothetical protein